MRRSIVRRSALGVALVLAGVASARAGYRLTDSDGAQTLVSKGRVKELVGDGEGPQSVFDLGTARAWMSNPDRKIYWEGTIDELCATLRDTASAMAKSIERSMEAQIANLPAESRAKIDALRQSLAAKRAEDKKTANKPAKVTIQRTGETTTIAGQPTRKYRVLVDGNLYEEDWLTTDPAFAREFALDKASAVMSRVSACAQSGETSGRPQGIDEGLIYQKLYPQGWPLRAVSHADGKTAIKSEIDKIEKQDIPEEEFKPPAGFRKAALGEVMFSGMNGGGGEIE